MNDTDDRMLKGIPASSGIVIGRAYVLDTHHLCILEHTLPPDARDKEVEAFREAVTRTNQEMADLHDEAQAAFEDDAPLAIFDAHAQILKDSALLNDVESIIIKRGCNAEWALKILLEKYEERFSRIKNSYFRERLDDIEQVVTNLQRRLLRSEGESLATITEPVIIVAHELTPADTLQMNRKMVVGFAIDAGGRTSHVGILASSMDIPAVVGLADISRRVRSGDTLIIDGASGDVVVNPSRERFLDYTRRRQKFLYFDEELHAQKDLAATTTDRVTIAVMANIESSDDLASLAEHGAEGVGLFRTEYLYLNRSAWPDEEAHFTEYKKVAERVDPHSGVIRTLDLGGDKIAASSTYRATEPNPALGLRAIRYCLHNQDVFITQLRAILRASHYGPLKIMYPLITSLSELDAANAILDRVKSDLRSETIPFNEEIEVGIMIETPASVVIADLLAKKCDFFSIGTNDLIQYSMAVDRINEKVAYLYEPLSPAILRMLSSTITVANKAAIPVSVCGKMAGDPTYALLLLGMGEVKHLSMDIHSIPRIKKFIRSISAADAIQVATDALSCGSTDEVRELMKVKMGHYLQEGVASELIGSVS